MRGFNLSEWALGHRSVVAFLMIIAVGAGLASYYRLGRSEDPTFIIKTMVVQAAWPGATIEDTLKQVTERIERKLQETPKLDFLRSYTDCRQDDDLRQSARQRHRQGGPRHLVPRAQEHRRYRAHPADGRHRSGLQRRLRRHLRHHLRLHGRRLHASRAARLCRGHPLQAPRRRRRLQDRGSRSAGRADLRRVLDAGARQPRHRPLGIDRRPAGAERRASRRHHPDRLRAALAARVGRAQIRAGPAEHQLRRSAAACCASAT